MVGAVTLTQPLSSDLRTESVSVTEESERENHENRFKMPVDTFLVMQNPLYGSLTVHRAGPLKVGP